MLFCWAMDSFGNRWIWPSEGSVRVWIPHPWPILHMLRLFADASLDWVSKNRQALELPQHGDHLAGKALSTWGADLTDVSIKQHQKYSIRHWNRNPESFNAKSWVINDSMILITYSEYWALAGKLNWLRGRSRSLHAHIDYRSQRQSKPSFFFKSQER